ncbi:hypothetical protein O0L34_g14397 [Tuta absoluta]|nr:hypothetical protein O0L34_g14397 [Tuta absoluta]
MYLSLVCILALQFGSSLNKVSDCGCSLGRIHSEKKPASSLFQFSHEDHCPIEYRPENAKDQTLGVSDEMVLIPAGSYQVGTDDVAIESDKEGPKRIVELRSFYLDKYEVSNRDFSRFTKLTGYKTEAETFGDSFVFSLFLNSTYKEKLKDFRVVQALWWYKVLGADWKHPYGPDSDLTGALDHPVIHISWNDAKAYCAWRGARLPSEAEWEAACRGGHEDTDYPWGNKLFPDRKHMANIWQGTFPNHNSAKDGFIGTSPVNMFPPNDFGLYNMAGNVWEWTEDDWSSDMPQEKVKKGGSYLCHRSYCFRYRCSARSHNTADSSAGNLGFRCAKSA